MSLMRFYIFSWTTLSFWSFYLFSGHTHCFLSSVVLFLVLVLVFGVLLLFLFFYSFQSYRCSYSIRFLTLSLTFILHPKIYVVNIFVFFFAMMTLADFPCFVLISLVLIHLAKTAAFPRDFMMKKENDFKSPFFVMTRTIYSIKTSLFSSESSISYEKISGQLKMLRWL